jgi:hypothetical protein
MEESLFLFLSNAGLSKKMSAAEVRKGNGKRTGNKSIKMQKRKFEKFWYRNNYKSLQKLQIKKFGTMTEMAHFFLVKFHYSLTHSLLHLPRKAIMANNNKSC